MRGLPHPPQRVELSIRIHTQYIGPGQGYYAWTLNERYKAWGRTEDAAVKMLLGLLSVEEV